MREWGAPRPRPKATSGALIRPSGQNPGTRKKKKEKLKKKKEPKTKSTFQEGKGKKGPANCVRRVTNAPEICKHEHGFGNVDFFQSWSLTPLELPGEIGPSSNYQIGGRPARFLAPRDGAGSGYRPRGVRPTGPAPMGNEVPMMVQTDMGPRIWTPLGGWSGETSILRANITKPSHQWKAGLGWPSYKAKRASKHGESSTRLQRDRS